MRRARNLGRILFLVLMGVVAAVGALLGIGNALDADEPVHWGTFTEERCEEGGRYGCQSIGRWVSDDGSIRLDDVQLDGRPSADGTVEASYQPTGIMNDADRNIVHSPLGATLEPFAPWMLVALCVGAATFQWREWRMASQ